MFKYGGRVISLKTIVLNGDYGYLDEIETTIKSIIFNNKEVKIYVINPDIPHEWFINLNQYLSQIGSQIVDKKIDQAYLNNVNSSFKGIKNIAFARILIPELIKEDKVLYLDCDIVVNANLDELFNTISFNDEYCFYSCIILMSRITIIRIIRIFQSIYFFL